MNNSWPVIMLSLFVLTACMGGRSSIKANIYAQAAQTAIEGGDWATARGQWALAVEAGEQDKISEGELASLYYEYGRAAGATCMFELAADNLNRAYQLELEEDGPAYLAQAELGRLEIKLHHYSVALAHLENALHLYDSGRSDGSTDDELAALKMDYARVLEALGEIEAADAVRMEVYKLREQDSRSQKALTFEPTPYGEFCLN
ncbi:MAG: hypothetical protein ACR2P6_08830 [Gammaproteobacteria bacterium]